MAEKTTSLTAGHSVLCWPCQLAIALPGNPRGPGYLVPITEVPAHSRLLDFLGVFCWHCGLDVVDDGGDARRGP